MTTQTKKQSVDKTLSDHGFMAYATGGGRYSLHRIRGGHVATFKTKREAANHALALPKFTPPAL